MRLAEHLAIMNVKRAAPSFAFLYFLIVSYFRNNGRYIKPLRSHITKKCMIDGILAMQSSL